MDRVTVNKITKVAATALSALQRTASRSVGFINAVWEVDDTFAIEVKPFSAVDQWQGKGEPTHWWKNERWTPVNFLSLAETKDVIAPESSEPVKLEDIDFDDPKEVEKLKRQKVEVEVGLLAYLLGYYYTGGGEPNSLNERLDDSMAAVKD